MKSLRLYAIGRIGFGVASLAVPAAAGRILAGPGGALPDAQAFLRGMGGREIGLGLGLLAAIQRGGAVRPWVVAAVMGDSADLVGIVGAWSDMPPAKRWIGLGSAGAAAAAGVRVLASLPR